MNLMLFSEEDRNFEKNSTQTLASVYTSRSTDGTACSLISFIFVCFFILEILFFLFVCLFAFPQKK